MDDVSYTPIGRVRSPFETPGDVVHEAVDETEGRIVLDEAYERGLNDLDGFSHVVVLAHLDGVDEYRLTAQPSHVDDLDVGVFAARSPFRPNPIAQTVVELTGRAGTTLHVCGLDLADGTPVLDLKPYVPTVDDSEVSLGWLEKQ